MEMSCSGTMPSLPLLLFVLPFSLLSPTTSQARVGVTYRPSNPNAPKVTEVITKLKDMGIPRVRLIEPDQASLAAFAKTGIAVEIVTDDYKKMIKVAVNESVAQVWVKDLVGPPTDSLLISSVSIGYDALIRSPGLFEDFMLALSGVNDAIIDLDYPDIVVATSHSFQVITKAFPPSEAEFVPKIQPLMNHLLKFLYSIKSPFQIELQPYQEYWSDAIPDANLVLALFEVDPESRDAMVDPGSGLRYGSIFEMMVDATVAALTKSGYGDMPIEVVATGWPTWGGVDERAATKWNAMEYNQRLVTFLNTRNGTPARPNQLPQVYIQSLFDDDWNVWNEMCKARMGILNNDTSNKYEINWERSHGTIYQGPSIRTTMASVIVVMLLIRSQ